MRTPDGISAALYVRKRGRVFDFRKRTKSNIPQDHRIFCVNETVIRAVQHSKFISTSGKQKVASLTSCSVTGNVV
jgi:hypothetical protein